MNKNVGGESVYKSETNVSSRIQQPNVKLVSAFFYFSTANNTVMETAQTLPFLTHALVKSSIIADRHQSTMASRGRTMARRPSLAREGCPVDARRRGVSESVRLSVESNESLREEKVEEASSIERPSRRHSDSI